MLRIIKCAVYIAIIYGIIGMFRHINDQRDEIAASVQQMAGNFVNSTRYLLLQTTNNLRNSEQELNNTLQNETKQYMSELKQ